MAVNVNVDKEGVKRTIENRINNMPRGIIPFTSGCLIFLYAWFWPTGYGHWLGSIVRAFRDANGW